MNPKEAAGLSQIRWFPGRSNTLGRRFDASRLACNSARPDAEDSSVRGETRGESSAVGSEMRCFVGGRETLEPRTWDQGGRAQASSRTWSFRPRIPQSSRLWSTTDERTQRTQRCVTAFPLERVSTVKTPGAAADLACPQGRRESKPSRGRETPRTDGVGKGVFRRIRSLRRRR